MDYQQKLLYISGFIVVGVTILVAIRQFESTAKDTSIDMLTKDLLYIGTKAQTYYFTPPCLKGGGFTFSELTANSKGLKKLSVNPENVNGCFKIAEPGNKDFVIIQTVGKEDYDGDGQNLTIEARIYADSVQTYVVNY